jgi:hypothetical protein
MPPRNYPTRSPLSSARKAASPTRPVDEIAAAVARGKVIKAATRVPRRRFPIIAARHGIVRRATP